MARLGKTEEPLSVNLGVSILRLAVGIVLLSSRLAADPISISNGNASIRVDPASVFGLESYMVDGEEQLFEQQFWYRLPSETFEQPIHLLSLVFSGAEDNTIQLGYQGATFGVDLTYRLTGGTAGSGLASLQETITLRNLTGTELPLTWFMEADFDLAGFGGADMATGGLNGILQSTGDTQLVVHPSLTPDAFQIAPFPDLFLSLGDLSVTKLDNTGSPFGPGDASFAFQWDFVLPPNGELTYTIDKAFVPEPGTLWLYGAAAAFLALRAALHQVVKKR